MDCPKCYEEMTRRVGTDNPYWKCANCGETLFICGKDCEKEELISQINKLKTENEKLKLEIAQLKQHIKSIKRLAIG